jgi:hypothetical protein
MRLGRWSGSNGWRGRNVAGVSLKPCSGVAVQFGLRCRVGRRAAERVHVVRWSVVRRRAAGPQPARSSSAVAPQRGRFAGAAARARRGLGVRRRSSSFAVGWPRRSGAAAWRSRTRAGIETCSQIVAAGSRKKEQGRRTIHRPCLMLWPVDSCESELAGFESVGEGAADRPGDPFVPQRKTGSLWNRLGLETGRALVVAGADGMADSLDLVGLRTQGAIRAPASAG